MMELLEFVFEALPLLGKKNGWMIVVGSLLLSGIIIAVISRRKKKS